MRKTLITLSIIAILSAVAITGCGNDEASSQVTTATTEPATIVVTEAATTAEPTESTMVTAQVMTEPPTTPEPTTADLTSQPYERATDENGDYYEPLYNAYEDADGNPIVPIFEY